MDYSQRLETSNFYFLLEIQRALCAVEDIMNIWTLEKFHSEDFYWRFKAKFDPAGSQLWYSFGIFIPIFQGVRVLWAQSFCLMGRSCPLIPCRDVTDVFLGSGSAKEGTHLPQSRGHGGTHGSFFQNLFLEEFLWKAHLCRVMSSQEWLQQLGILSLTPMFVWAIVSRDQHWGGQRIQDQPEPGDKMLVNKV